MSPAGRRSAQAGAPDRVHEQPRRRALVDIRGNRRLFPRVSPFLSFFENSQKGTVMSTAPSAAVRTFPRIGVKATRKATVIAFLAWLFAVYDYILFGTLLPEIAHRFGWTEATPPRASPRHDPHGLGHRYRFRAERDHPGRRLPRRCPSLRRARPVRAGGERDLS